MKEAVIIGGKRYSLETSAALCTAAGMFETVTLYRTKRGAFFTLTESADTTKTGAALLTEEEARAFVDAHPLGIVEAEYIAAFGTPAEG